ncbi:MAG TPA: ectoine/hydroxyectoine ABC transporter substrate-binding protein EhuB [Roseiflexaceae bacterium]|jgi:polar amino acid transport system substrate-binding protein|nr:ectoine/hydroxyectoine ABC transporter substrate-binding protein EhuB [Roseiflexaceae bacterium]
MRRSFRIGFVFALIAVVLIALVLMINRPEDTLERARQSGSIRVGYAPEAPFAFRTRAGSVTGESPEVAREVLRRMGITNIEWVQTEWGSLIPDLKAGRFDIIATGMFITCDRARQIAFTQPTFRVDEALLVAKGNPKHLHSYADIKAHPDARLAVVNGAVEARIAEEQGIPPGRILPVPDAQTGLIAVRSGRVDALGLTSISVAALASRDPAHVEHATPFEMPLLNGHAAEGYGALGVRQEDRALLEELNQQLEHFIGSDAHLRLLARFGFTHDELPTQDATPLHNCQPGQ